MHIQLPKRLVKELNHGKLGKILLCAFGIPGIGLFLLGVILCISLKTIACIGMVISGMVFTIVAFCVALLGGKTTLIMDEDTGTMELIRAPFPLYKRCRPVTKEEYPLSEILDVVWLISASQKGGFTYRIGFEHVSGETIYMTPFSTNMIPRSLYDEIKLWFDTWVKTHRAPAPPVTIGFGPGPAAAGDAAAMMAAAAAGMPGGAAALQQQMLNAAAMNAMMMMAQQQQSAAAAGAQQQQPGQPLPMMMMMPPTLQAAGSASAAAAAPPAGATATMMMPMAGGMPMGMFQMTATTSSTSDGDDAKQSLLGGEGPEYRPGPQL